MNKGDNDTGNKWSLMLYTAPWCKACKHLEPVMDELMKEWEGKVMVRVVDVDKDSDAANRRGIRGLPTLILADGGREVVRMVGNRSKRDINNLLTDMVDSGEP